MKKPNHVSFVLFGFALILTLLSCKTRNSQVNEIQISLDSLYMKVLTVAFNGKCFYSLPSPEQMLNNTEIDSLAAETYIYFDRKFEDFLIDSTIVFDYKQLNLLAKKSESIVEVDSISLSTFGQIFFRKASEPYTDIDYKDLASFGFGILQNDPNFNGFIIFSKPILRKNSDQTFEIFIRVTKMLDSPRNCFVRIIFKENIIIDAQELLYTEKLIFR